MEMDELSGALDRVIRQLLDKSPNEYSLKIFRTDNGYILRGTEKETVIEDDEQDELKSHEQLLWEVMEYFGFAGSKHDPERIRIKREKGA